MVVFDFDGAADVEGADGAGAGGGGEGGGEGQAGGGQCGGGGDLSACQVNLLGQVVRGGWVGVQLPPGLSQAPMGMGGRARTAAIAASQ
ncbi:hypothetical protein [Nocardia cyriacigeorgica]|uniref:hypothetical protein n=1 Tax=Nocardia cyriacigeorgica TaxID=135487 RepID=UPI0021574856|nr:hypothetical protein [Nocardia cyriacigeorgica]